MEIKKAPTAIICLSPNNGGMEIDSIKLAKKLSIFSSIVVIARSGYFIESKKEEYVGFNGIKLKTIDFNSSLSFNIIFKTRRIVKEYGIQNVIFFGASELKSLYFSFLGLDINLIVRHGTTKSRAKKDWFHKLIYSDVNYHVSISNHLLANVRSIIPFGTNTKEILIYPSFAFTEPKSIIQKKIIILHVGRIAEGKGHIDAIKACKSLVDNNIEFEFNIVGGMEENFKIKFMTFYENCEYKNKINLIGFSNNVRKYIEKANIFLFPSYGEGFGNSFIEALSNNIVCIAYRNTTFIEFGNLGFYFNIVENKNINLLSKKLLLIAEDYSNERNKCRNNSSVAKNIFSIEEERKNYLKLLM